VRLTADSPELVVRHVAAIATLGADVTMAADDDVAERVRGLADNLAGLSR
jgi:hypothetical protein